MGCDSRTFKDSLKDQSEGRREEGRDDGRRRRQLQAGVWCSSIFWLWSPLWDKQSCINRSVLNVRQEQGAKEAEILEKQKDLGWNRSAHASSAGLLGKSSGMRVRPSANSSMPGADRSHTCGVSLPFPGPVCTQLWAVGTHWELHSQPAPPKLIDFYLFSYLFNCTYFDGVFKAILLPDQSCLCSTPLWSLSFLFLFLECSHQYFEEGGNFFIFISNWRIITLPGCVLFSPDLSPDPRYMSRCFCWHTNSTGSVEELRAAASH